MLAFNGSFRVRDHVRVDTAKRVTRGTLICSVLSPKTYEYDVRHNVLMVGMFIGRRRRRLTLSPLLLNASSKIVFNIINDQIVIKKVNSCQRAKYVYMMKITEKSDMYSSGVVMLEVLTGKQPIDPTILEGLHIVDWIRQRRVRADVLDSGLLARPESKIEEMLQTLGVAMLCVNPSPKGRATKKDVAAMVEEIRQDREECSKAATNRQEHGRNSTTIGQSAGYMSWASLAYSSDSNFISAERPWIR